MLQKIIDDHDVTKFEDGLEEATVYRAVADSIQDTKHVMSKQDQKRSKCYLDRYSNRRTVGLDRFKCN